MPTRTDETAELASANHELQNCSDERTAMKSSSVNNGNENKASVL